MNLVFQGTIDTAAAGTTIDCIHDNMLITLIVINNIINISNFEDNEVFNKYRFF